MPGYPRGQLPQLTGGETGIQDQRVEGLKSHGDGEDKSWGLDAMPSQTEPFHCLSHFLKD